MARNTGAVSTWEERGSSAIQKDRCYLRGPDVDGFMHFSNDGPNDADMVEFVDGFWGMTAAPDVGQTTARFFVVGGFISAI